MHLTSEEKTHASVHASGTDLGFNFDDSLSNCDHHSFIGQHAFKVIQQLLQSSMHTYVTLADPSCTHEPRLCSHTAGDSVKQVLPAPITADGV